MQNVIQALPNPPNSETCLEDALRQAVSSNNDEMIQPARQLRKKKKKKKGNNSLLFCKQILDVSPRDALWSERIFMLLLKGPILYQFANLQVEHLSRRKGPQLGSFSNLCFLS